MSRFSKMVGRSAARPRDVEMLRECMLRPDLIGGIAFLGKDLGLPEVPVYDKECMPDLITLTDRAGENDLFTRVMAGPVFHAGERLLRHFKVSNTVGASHNAHID
jgi:hypothetical protein